MSFAATRTLATYGAELKLADVPREAVENAKLLALDTIGVALAAAPLPIGTKIIGHIQQLGGSPVCTVIGSRIRTSPPLAALANGVLTSGLDFDAGFHLTTHTLPAALAVGEQLNATGSRVLEAFIAGYEAGARLIDAMDSGRSRGGGLTAEGWYHVGLVGPLVSAVVAGKLLGLDVSALCGAIGIAAATAGGVRRNFGTMAKAYQAGNAASQGVQAAMLAADGFNGDPEILEAPLGLFAALGVPPEGVEHALAQLGTKLELLASLRIKRYPACTPAHQPIQIALQLKREHGFAVEDIEMIEADLHTFSLLRLDPQDDVAAGFSAPFLISVALLDGEMGLDQLREERIHDRRVRELMARVRSSADSFPSGGDEQAETITLRMRDGRVLTSQSKRVNRMDSRDDIDEKFRYCAGHSLAPEQVERLREQVMRMEDLASIGELLSIAAPA
ncbi:MAG TPA: MmgE/PrpD family protein [Chloroflexota bacterium]|nr:MmgE/PrpD family protein [Chloroflexota bacterium]